MKILLVGRCVTSLPPRSGGGAEWHGYHLAKELDKLGHEVHYVTNCKEPLEFNGIKVYNTYRKISSTEINRFPLPFMSFNTWVLKHFKENMLAARKARSVLAKEKDFDVIHCHGNLAALILSKERVPVVFTEHDATPWMCTYRSFYERFIRKSSYYLLNKKAMERVSHVITVSSAQRKFLIEKWQFNLKKITTIPNGVDTAAFKPDNNGKDILKKHSLPEDYSIFVGRLEPRKGIDYLIRSMKGFNMASVIVGSGPDRSRLEELAKKSGVSSRITFTGGVSDEDLRHLYSNAKFFVLPSISEGMPLTVLEAMASGIPVVANNINGIPEIVQHGYNGLLAEPRDINSFMNAQQILLKDAMLRKKMGKRARETVEKNYSWKTVAHRVIDVYEKVLW